MQKSTLLLKEISIQSVPVKIVRRLHCSSTPPCLLPAWVKGISNIKRRMLWVLSKSVFLSCNSFSSKYGITCVTWIYAYFESKSLGFTLKTRPKRKKKSNSYAVNKVDLTVVIQLSEIIFGLLTFKVLKTQKTLILSEGYSEFHF